MKTTDKVKCITINKDLLRYFDLETNKEYIIINTGTYTYNPYFNYLPKNKVNCIAIENSNKGWIPQEYFELVKTTFSTQKELKDFNAIERLEYAKLNYPIGTVYKTLYNSGKTDNISETVIYPIKDGYSNNALAGGVGYIYSGQTNTWAEIVKNEIKIETGNKNLIIGETYYHDSCDFGWLFKFSKKTSTNYKGTYCISNKHNRSFYIDYSNAIGNYEFRLATKEEKDWLDYCILKDMYISKEDFLQDAINTQNKNISINLPDSYAIGVDLYNIDKQELPDEYFVPKKTFNWEIPNYNLNPLTPNECFKTEIKLLQPKDDKRFNTSINKIESVTIQLKQKNKLIKF